MANLNRDGTREEVWDAIEDTYLQSIRVKREKEDRKAREDQQKRLEREKDALLNLWGQRKRLVDELSKIDDEIHSTRSRITFDENNFAKRQALVTQQREKEDAQDRELLRTHRFAGQHHRWPAKNGHPQTIAPQAAPNHYQPQPYSQPPPVYAPPPRSPVYPPNAEVLPAQRHAEIALAALGNGHVAASVPDEQRANGVPPSPSRTDAATVRGAAAPVIAQGPANGTAAEHAADRNRVPDSARTVASAGAEAERPKQLAPAPPGSGGIGAAGRPAAPQTTGPPQMTGVEVYDSEGNLIGEVKHLEQRNVWIREAVKLPVRRRVVIRAGRKFGPEDLEKIYEPTDNKGAKWLSCMIQAAGEVQGQQCVTCTKNIGVFSECVIVGSETFPRCANCEWNRQGCHGAAPVATRPKSPLATRPKSRHSVASGEAPHMSPRPTRRSASLAAQSAPSGGFTAVNSSASGAKSQRYSEGADGRDSSPQATKERKSLPGGRASDVSGEEGVSSALKKSKGHRKSLPDGPNHRGDDEEPEVEEDEDTEEITKDLLVMEHNGVVFTAPEIMRGVPLEKISPGHPYWDPSWPPLEAFITPTLEKWKEKYDKALDESASQSSKYLANRQVNRGNAVLKYLRDGPIHPLQIIARRFVTKKLFNYDTIHRLVQILDELLKFKIDVTPAQWVRHRLHQKFLEKGDEFSLDEEIDALYHDPKVRYIRKKSGFGNIGRPSGYRMKGELGGTPKKGSRGTKRKKSASPERPALPLPEPRGPKLAPRPVSAHEDHHQPSPVLGRRPGKKHKADHHPAVEPAGASTGNIPPQNPGPAPGSAGGDGFEDLESAGYTSHDSYSRDPIWRHDWRVYQVKTAHMTSNPSVTQYYHWVDRGADGTEEFCFEHQVLKDVIPPNKVTWGVYKDPFDFHLRLSELVDVKWSRDSLKMLAVTRQVPGVEWRGDVIVNFKRERTKRRFLMFLARKQVKLVRSAR